MLIQFYGLHSILNMIFAYAKSEAQVSYAVTAQLICALIFTTRIVKFLFLLYPNKSSFYPSFVVAQAVLCRKPRRPDDADNFCEKLGSFRLHQYFYLTVSETCCMFVFLLKSLMLFLCFVTAVFCCCCCCCCCFVVVVVSRCFNSIITCLRFLRPMASP